MYTDKDYDLNAIFDGSTNNAKERLKHALDNSHALNNSRCTFRWSKTPQGQDYWQNICNNGHTDESRKYIADMMTLVDGGTLVSHKFEVGERIQAKVKFPEHARIEEGEWATITKVYDEVIYYITDNEPSAGDWSARIADFNDNFRLFAATPSAEKAVKTIDNVVVGSIITAKEDWPEGAAIRAGTKCVVMSIDDDGTIWYNTEDNSSRGWGISPKGFDRLFSVGPTIVSVSVGVGEVEKLQDRIKELEVELAQAQAECTLQRDAYETKEAELNTKIKGLHSNCNEYIRQRDAYKSDLHTVIRQRNEYRDEVSALRVEVERLEKTNKQITKVANEEMEDLRNQITEAKRPFWQKWNLA